MRELTFFPLLERYPMTSPYGQRIDPITGAPGSFHRGVDYGAPGGAPVIAPFDGQVTTGYEGGGAGNWLWVQNGPDLFKSFHHASHAVFSGWHGAGTVLAYIDSTGASTGAHAHLELWENGTNIDPTGYLERAPLFGEDEDDMTDDDFNRIASLMSSIMEDKIQRFLTPSHMLYDHECQWRLNEKLERVPVRSPGLSGLLRETSLVANAVVNKSGPSPDAVNVNALPQDQQDAFYSLPIAESWSREG